MILRIEDLKDLRTNNHNSTIVLATGTFDLFHYEHLRYLEDAKKLGSILVVAVKDNKGASFKSKGNPIIDENQRVAIVDSLKYVDYTVIARYDKGFNKGIPYDNKEQRQWLQIFCSIFESLNPDILYYERNLLLQAARERVFERYNINGMGRDRTEIVSTSKIKEKILQGNNIKI